MTDLLKIEGNSDRSVICLNTDMRRFKQLVFGKLPILWKRLQQSRSVAKVSKFYIVFAVVLFAEFIYSVRFHSALLNVHESSPYFDFRATPIEEASIRRPTCTVAKGFHPFAWASLTPFIANYRFFPRLVLLSSWATALAAVLSVFCFVAFRHFQNIPRSRYARPKPLQLGAAFVCKNGPGAVRLLFGLCLFLALTSLFAVHVLNACQEKLVEIGAPLGRIANCRKWVRLCAGITDNHGLHIDCSLAENFEAFPHTVCEENSGVCGFPTRQGVVELVEGGLCAGEDFEDEPLPNCPLCSLARRDQESRVYREPFRHRRSKTSFLEIEFNKTTSWEWHASEDTALRSSYVKALRFYSQGSHLSNEMDRWALMVILTGVGYQMLASLGFAASNEGYFRKEGVFLTRFFSKTN